MVPQHDDTSNDCLQDAATISDALHYFREVMTQKPALAKMIKYTIYVKGHKEVTRRSHLLDYEIDTPTLDFLADWHRLWSTYPSFFANWAKSSPLQDPWAQIVRECLQAEQDNV